ncbi:MAG: Holliday junction resolvase RuvX [Oscillospiraceae bacterium]|nr:Holliday junction resolvase RuvX [Oscillospiraceae bacterium]
MRIMAIDYGDARTGIAVSDETQTLAGDAWVVHNKRMEQVAQAICDEATTRNVGCIVIGYPKNMDGSIGARAEKSEQLAELLRSLCDIDVTLWDERMTTISAHQVLTNVGKHGKKRKKTVDAVAASLILDNYLSYLKR